MQLSPEEVIAVARSFQNVVIEGPPGTGKTRLIGEVAKEWRDRTGRALGGCASGEWAITLHPGTSYEDFIGGLRAGVDGRFGYRPGWFQQRVELAFATPEQDFLVLLDELNRANVPRVLGDAMLTIEASKRLRYDDASTAWGGGTTVALPGGDVDLDVPGVDGFGMPDNLYVLATMNTTDRSVAGLDSALRRRFAFVRLPPLGAADIAQDVEALHGPAVRAAIEPSALTLGRLNDDLLLPVLGADHVLGHSYLFDAATALDGTLGGDGGAELAALAEELRTGTTGGRTIEEAFWVEVGKSTSVKRNQVDLSKRGRSGAEGSAHYFVGPQLPTGATTRVVTVEHDGIEYTGSELKLYGGEHANLTWRLNLNGTAGTEKLGDLGWTVIRLHALVFLRVGPDHYVMRSLPLSAIPQLSAWGTSDQVPASDRQFGRLTLSQDVADPTPTALRRAWQYALLPQLIDLVAAQGAEALVVAGDRAPFLLTRGELTEAQRAAAETAGTRLDEHLRALGLQVRADGTGLSRTLVVDQAPPHEHAPAPVPAATAPDGGSQT